jgi:hypothetical protein
MLSIAFFPQLYIRTIAGMLDVIHPFQADPGIIDGLIDTSARVSLYSVILVGIAATVWLIRWMVLNGKPAKRDVTWGCGYVAPGSRLQYTGKSFSKPLGKIFNTLLIEKKQFEEVNKGEIFPEKRSYISHYQDFFEHNIIQPITRRMVDSANYFSFIQNGRIQSYVLYGIIFILAVFILSVFNIVS